MIKNLYLLLVVSIFTLFTSCAMNTNIPTDNDTNVISDDTAVEEIILAETTSSEDITIVTETAAEEETMEEKETEEINFAEEITEEQSGMASLYTIEEIRDIFEKERESFNAVKELFLEREYELYIMRKADPKDSAKSVLMFTTWEQDENRRTIHYPIEELEGYETIIDFITKYNISSIQGSSMTEIDDNIIVIGIKYAHPQIHQQIIYSIKDHYSNPENRETEGIKLDEYWFYQLFLGV